MYRASRYLAPLFWMLGTVLLRPTAVVHAGSSPERFPLALTIDDLPWGGPAAARAELSAVLPGWLKVLGEHAVPVAGFVVCDASRDWPAALNAWIAAGVELGNHSSSHPDLNAVSIDMWRADVEACDAHLRAVAAQARRPWFRFPMLHEGATPQQYDAAHGVLRRLGLRNVPVSVDTSEWLIASAWRTESSPQRRARLAALLLDHLSRTIRHARAEARERYGREIAQILLLHANALNASQWSAVLEQLESEGADLIGLETALADPVYTLDDDYRGTSGLSWIYRTKPSQPERGDWDDAEAMRVREAIIEISADRPGLAVREPS